MPQSIYRDWAVEQLASGLYPQREDHMGSWLDRIAGRGLGKLAWWASPLERARLARFAASVEAAGEQLSGLSDAALQSRVGEVRRGLCRHGLAAQEVANCFALVREASQRLLGKKHYPVQIMGGYLLLNGGLAEMATGEGKTLTAALPAVTVALCGQAVHVVTVNDYLAERDARLVEPLYAFFGLSVGAILSTQERAERARAYACDITYCVNKDLVFDYLRDGLAASGDDSVARLAVSRYLEGETVQPRHSLRGLCYAIIDEADSILIDEARTPLIISSESGAAAAAADCASALDIARTLAPEAYELLHEERTVRLLPPGRTAIDRAAQGMTGIWRFRKAREELLRQALAALHLYARDRHYIVAEGKLSIVDEFTGRTMADRSWERGLHQLIEIKEGLEATKRRDTIARITYQRFFRRYLRLAGMTGTGAEVAPELRAVFGLASVRIPTNRPLARRALGERVFLNDAARWAAVVERVIAMRAAGRATLVGTRSVEASETLSSLLSARGVEHALLNARQNAEEAAIIAQAGQPGRVTVATNMAGRGTDILLAAEVREAGGLHVILSEFHESRRIDRQLYGRAGRQGDPGSYESLVSLDDDLFHSYAATATAWAHRRYAGAIEIPPWAGRLLRWLAQSSAERIHARIRARTLKSGEQINRSLAFSGRGE
ncbi:MAG: preprotein translocase subunit SecA [Rhodocyclaceae bacterium]|nr:preprotein translocase subunit SecA [Rhodocyclaceae bacterium]